MTKRPKRAKKTRTLRCPNCERRVAKTAAFCGGCGMRLTERTALARQDVVEGEVVRRPGDYAVAGPDRRHEERMRDLAEHSIGLAHRRGEVLVVRPPSTNPMGIAPVPTIGGVQLGGSPLHNFGFQRQGELGAQSRHNPKRAVQSQPGALCPEDAQCDYCDQERTRLPKADAPCPGKCGRSIRNCRCDQ